MTERPFSSGSQFAEWCSLNCERCVKYEPEGAPAACEIDAALFDAQMGNGSMPTEMAERLGYVAGTAFWTDDEPHPVSGEAGFAFVWDCPERVLNATAIAREDV